MSEGFTPKSPVTIALDDGTKVVGKFVRYEHAALVFDTTEGRRSVPFELLPEELQECFPDDPCVIMRRIAEQCEQGALRMQAAAEKSAEAMRGFDAVIPQIEAQRAELVAEVETLRAENAALHAENTALMRSQRG